MGATLLEGFGVVRSNTAKMLSLVRLGWNSVGSTDTSTAGLRMSFERTFFCPSNYGTDDLLVHRVHFFLTVLWLRSESRAK